MLPLIIRKFIATESASGLLLIFAAVAAMICANITPLQEYYSRVFSHNVLFGINDGLMVLFFLLIGMEIKRELLEGELSTRAQAMLPAVAAVGGMVVPALLYACLNWHDASCLHGWATASATDIAFSLCVLNLCGSTIPTSLKVFLTAVAVIDDLGAIIIIAMFYTDALHLVWLAGAGGVLGVLWVFNKKNIASLPLMLGFGVMLWFCVLQSGVHATIAGVLLGLMIPLRPARKTGDSMLLRLERALHPGVSYAVLPLFAFANAGITLADISPHSLAEPVTLGVIVGLFAGKQMGIFLFTAAPVMAGFAHKPQDASWLQIYGVAILAGIGFTMSLFIGGLAFGQSHHFVDAKLGVIVGSLLSALVGYGVLRTARISG